MTSRVNALTVILESDVRSDDVEPLMNAIMQLRGVLSIVANEADIAAAIAQSRVRRELCDKLVAVVTGK